MECLTDLIGITRTDCPCITDGMTDEQKSALRVSKSGLYIDEQIQPSVDLRQITGGFCTDFYNTATMVRRAAEKKVADDIKTAINSRYAKNKATFTGNIGEKPFAATAAVTQRFNGMVVKANSITDAVIKLYRIDLLVNVAASFTVKIMRAVRGHNYGEVIHSFPVSSNANAFSPVTIPSGIELPLRIDGNPMDYYFYYDTQEAGGLIQPKDNKIDCGCSGKASNTLYNYVTTNGFQAANMDSLGGVSLDSTYARGIILTVDVRCIAENLFCKEFRDDDAVAVAMAWALMYQTEVLLVGKLQGNAEITAYTTMMEDDLKGIKSHCSAQYDRRIAFLAKSMDVSASDCYVCRSSGNQPFMDTIKS